MNELHKKLVNILLITALIMLASVTTFGFQFTSDSQDFYAGSGLEELRPFDFSDKYYQENGIEPEAIMGRRTGFDKYSVIDFINSENHRNVRIICTSPTYGFDGRIQYSVLYGDFHKRGFTKDKAGEIAMEIANKFPIYIFPSDLMSGKARQAAVINTGDGYFEKNPLGIGVAVFVEFTKKIYTPKGVEEIERLLKRNGPSVDGTPILRSVDEIWDMTRKGLVRQTQRDWATKRFPAYSIFRTLEIVEKGAISPDSYLVMAKDPKGKILPREMMFKNEFECLQKMGGWCIDKK